MSNYNTHIPKYVQIADSLRKKVDEMYKEGKERFLSDDELIKMFDVSRMTIRQAVQLLVEEGLLKRMQGKGTFIVRKDKLKTDIAKLNTFFQGWYLEKNFNVKLLYRGSVPCPEGIDVKLGVKPGEEVYQVKRLRLSEGIPVVIDNRYLLKQYGEQITDEEYVNYSFSHLFLNKFNMTLSEGEIEIEAVLASQEISKILDVSIGSPILYRSVDLKIKKGCVLTGASSYRGDMYKYKSLLSLE
ncbi:GntR family transcriptional regulator [Priestia megaterium]|jgi:DNA-binding GntR family transcriptional regulator|uniref:GntR family transcriptional regulator n=1 Tax=Priestia megaterium TaxID=1404 RepID=UPI0021C0D2EC|nr:GntR family transcriptional regulator [Priestia megaterium]MCT9853347.1 GntR family transcriptional regulator [Priestia megaterium]MDF1964396.1 GntR family transcriptional regulator [Priestia megaterium]